MKTRKGQLSVFIIISILILFVIGIIFFINSKKNVFEKINPEVLPIYNNIRECLKSLSEESVYAIGQSGGYYIRPELSNDLGISYYFYNKKSYYPKKSEIEYQISKYIDELSYVCLRNFEEFNEIEVTSSIIKSNVTILDEKVIINAVYPITIKKSDKTYFFKNFNDIEIQVRLGKIYNLIDKLMQKQLEEPDYICFNCVADFASEEDLYANLMDYQNDSVIFTITDEKSLIKNEAYSFIFVNKYGSDLKNV